jgi:signal transduction histidine kinase
MFSRGGEPVKKTVPLSGVLHEVVSLAMAGSGIDCQFYIDEHLSPVAADEREIRQVLSNILTNAREAMPSGGALKISADNVTANPKDELPLLERDYVCISIEDSGSGIPKNQLQKIFDPYYTTKPLGIQKGMGLGLAICYSIIKKHDGFIDVESNVDEGTKISIYLPTANLGNSSLLAEFIQ